ncbi:MAG: endolytic transglycosylase MltG [Rikenellaceae bacterium]
MNKFLKAFGVLFLLSAVAVGVAYNKFLGSVVEKSEIIYISTADLKNVGYRVVVDSLILPHISNRLAFETYAKRLDLPERIKPGRYELSEGQSVIDIVRMLKLGIEKPTQLTFNNIRTPEQLAGRMAQQIEADSIEVLNVLGSEEVLSMVGFKNRKELMSIFIPNTYEIYWSTSPQKLVARMNREYQNFWTQSREEKRKLLNLSRLDVSTLASIVYEETIKSDEMPRVAGVYLNRLRIGMRLQADPTVKYAMGDFELKRILFKHLEYDSPYNTYKYGGLPPTPIAMPSIAAIDAVLNAEKHSYLYFCARPEFDGYHNFAKTLSEHNANSRSYSKELNRRNIK